MRAETRESGRRGTDRVKGARQGEKRDREEMDTAREERERGQKRQERSR